MGKQKEEWNKKTGLHHLSQWGEIEGGRLPLWDNCWNTDLSIRAQFKTHSIKYSFLARKLPHKIEAGSVHTSSGAASSKTTPSFPSHILWSEDDSAAAMFSPKAWKSCCCYMKNNFTFLASFLRLLKMAAGHLNHSSLNDVLPEVVNVWGSTRQCLWGRTGLTERGTV